jgi:hypothetical protein
VKKQILQTGLLHSSGISTHINLVNFFRILFDLLGFSRVTVEYRGWSSTLFTFNANCPIYLADGLILLWLAYTSFLSIIHPHSLFWISSSILRILMILELPPPHLWRDTAKSVQIGVWRTGLQIDERIFQSCI